MRRGYIYKTEKNELKSILWPCCEAGEMVFFLDVGTEYQLSVVKCRFFF